MSLSHNSNKPAEASKTEANKPAEAANAGFLCRATTSRLVDPFTLQEYPTSRDVEVASIKEGSWLDCQIKAGLISKRKA